MRKCANISPFMRRLLVIYDFAIALFWIFWYMKKIWFSFLSLIPLLESCTEPKILFSTCTYEQIRSEEWGWSSPVRVGNSKKVKGTCQITLQLKKGCGGGVCWCHYLLGRTIERSREYLMICRWPGFLAVVWFGSPPLLPSASCLSFILFLCVVGRAYWRGMGWEGVREEPNQRPPESLVFYTSFNILYGGGGVPGRESN